MVLANYPLVDQLVLVVSALILLTSFVLLTQNRIHSMINTFAWQSGLIVVATILQALATAHKELYVSAVITFLLKVLFVPYLMRYLVRKLNIRHKVAVIAHPFLLLIGAAILALFCYNLMMPIQASGLLLIENSIAVALAVTLLGMLLLITHHKVIAHIIGFMAMENGILFAALTSAQGMPMIVELGIAFDVLVATILFGVFFFHIRSSIDTLDANRMNLLREDLE
jgi:hydrogenase-4 component E